MSTFAGAVKQALGNIGEKLGFPGTTEVNEPKKFTYLRLGQPLKLGRRTLMPGSRVVVLSAQRRRKIVEYECFMGSDYPTFFVGYNHLNKIETEVSVEPKIELVVK